MLLGGSVGEVADVLAGCSTARSPSTTPTASSWGYAGARTLAQCGRGVGGLRPHGAPGAVWVAAAVAGAEHLGTWCSTAVAPRLREVEHRTLERGAVVTALVLLFARSVAEAEERLGGELLADLVDGAADPLLLRERLRRHGVALGDRPLVVAVASAGPDGRAACTAGGPHRQAERGLAAEHAGAVVLLAPGADAVDVGRRLRDAVEAADAGSGRVTVGVAVADGELPPAYADARRCLDVLLTLGRQGDVSDQAGLGVARLLLGTSGPDELAAFVDRTLGPVLAWTSGGDRAAGHPRRLVRHRLPGPVDGRAAARAPQHRRPAARPGRRVARTRVAGAGRSLDLQLALRMVQLQAAR